MEKADCRVRLTAWCDFGRVFDFVCLLIGNELFLVQLVRVLSGRHSAIDGHEL